MKLDITNVKDQKIDILLNLYADILNQIVQDINKDSVDYNSVKLAANKVLDESLSDKDLAAILKLEGSLNGKFPGVQNRLKNLLCTEVKERLLQNNKQ